MDKYQLIEIIEAQSFSSECQEELINSIEPFISLQANPASDVPLGASRFGGHPDLPKEIEWPIDEEGAPLSFLGSLNLFDLRGLDEKHLLPDSGWLLFFYIEQYEDDYSDFKVIYVNSHLSALERRLSPNEGEQVYPLQSVTAHLNFQVDYSLVYGLCDQDDVLETKIASPDNPAISISLYEALTGQQNKEQNQMLGYPHWIQDAPFESPHEQILLLQLDSSSNKEGFLWGDNGKLYFLIDAKDLINRSFEDVELEMQCH